MNCLKKQIRYYTLFRVLRWEFASVYNYTVMLIELRT